jgi:hypothetical protein
MRFGHNIFYKEEFVNRFSAVVLTAAAMMFAVGCGGGGGNSLGLKASDKLEVLETLDRERFEVSYGESAKNIDHTDGDFLELPKGTVLEVYVTPKSDAKIIEVKPVKLEGETDPEKIRDKLINARFLTSDFIDYSITLKVGYLGKEIKKVE